jgi:hypothetical protein
MSWGNLIKYMHELLIAAQAERDDRSQSVNDEPGWVAYEREVVLEAINEERTNRGFNTLTPDDVKRAETYAAGHVDYTWTFAIGCAKLAVGAPL